MGLQSVKKARRVRERLSTCEQKGHYQYRNGAAEKHGVLTDGRGQLLGRYWGIVMSLSPSLTTTPPPTVFLKQND